MNKCNGLWVLGAASVLLCAGTLSAVEPTPGVAIIDGQEKAVPAIAMGDAASVALILKEGKENNKVMEHITYITKQIGPRLTGSSNAEKANRWCASQYEAWGLTNIQVDQWGEIPTRFDRGPSSLKLVVRKEAPPPPAGEQAAPSSEPQYTTIKELQFTTLAWTRGTNGTVHGPVVWMPESETEYAKLKESGKLKGAWILVKAPPPAGRRGVQEGMAAGFTQRLEARKAVADGSKKVEELPLRQRIAFEGIAGFISASRDERVSTTSVPGWRERKADEVPEDIAIVVRRSDYDSINSRVADGEAVELEATLDHTLTAGPIPTYNTIAEIKGSEKPDEVVIVSAHLDSWNGPGSEGCTDNGTGSAVVLEAARILSTAIQHGAKPPKRTIRFINWTGEEQGLLGSKAYVDKHKDEIVKNVSACFVDDGGTDYEGGIPCIAEQVDYIAAATAPVNNLFYSETDKKWLNVNVRVGGQSQGGGSSDHASFNRIGVPGFFWDEVGRADYGYGWHTQNDKLDLAIPEYLVQSSTCMAVTAYNIACAPELLPRAKPKEEAKPADAKPAEATKKNEPAK